MDITPYEEFAEKRLGFKFHNINLLVTALTHRSYANEHRPLTEHNERLEYLGDAVLELVTSDYLFFRFDYPEGMMTAVRAKLVCTESICAAGRILGYEPLVRLSKGERRGANGPHDSILADCFEALIGAIYVDQGYDAARDFIQKHILSKTDEIIDEESWHDPKSYLQEYTQKYNCSMPIYRTLTETGPDHRKEFTVAVFIDNERRAVAKGHSKQEAQTNAARQVIRQYKKREEEEEAETEARKLAEQREEEEEMERGF